MSRYLIILAALTLLPRLSSAESFAAWAAKGQRLQKQGDEQDALGAYAQALKLWRRKDGSSAKARVLSARAELLEKSRRWSEAVEDLTAAARISTRTASYPYRIGRGYLELGRPADAITWFYKATTLNLDYKEAYYDRARAYEATGDLQFAREDYRTACQLGVKAACKRRKSLASGAKAQAPPSDEFAPQGSARRGPVEVRRAKPRIAKASVKNFPACLESLNKCVDDGATFGDCVSKADVCERRSSAACCPATCVKAFKSLANDKSEAEAFRETFSPDAACVGAR